MKHIKKHFKRMHKITIHPNRWLVWALALTFIIAMSLIFYIQISDRITEHQMSESSYLISRGVQFKDAYLGFALHHPRSWGVEFADRNIVTFSQPKDFTHGLSVSVFNEDDLPAVIDSLDIVKQEPVMIQNKEATWYLVEAENNTEDEVVIVAGNEMIYVIRGNTEWFGRIASTFFLLPLN